MLTVILLERVPRSLRGDLSRWMLEPKTGVFVGDVSSRVQEHLWQRVAEMVKDGSAVLIHANDSDLRLAFEVSGVPRRELKDFDGLKLVKRL